ncbi:MAG: transposase [Lachnospiraceae bacterium]|nr:transposase [Lachnospiraceae bacterium]
MPQNYTPEFKKKIVRLRLEEGRTINIITTEYSISKETIRRWCNELKKECQTSPDTKTEYDNMKEMLNLKRENEELRKENLFLKKAAAFFAKEID